MLDVSRTLRDTLKGSLIKNAPLSSYTSLRTGGCADYLYHPADLDDLTHLLKQLPADIPITFLGLGSNLLVRDQGVPGVVVVMQGVFDEITFSQPGLVQVGAGCASAKFARRVAKEGAEALAFLAGIPGTIGGALAMNAGCFGGETWCFVSSVETIDRSGIRRIRQPSDFKIGYREVERPNQEWFIAGHFSYPIGDPFKAQASIRTLLQRRHETQPTGSFNCGSVFRNPVGDHAGALIERAGLKGMRKGNAIISEKHANFIINEGDATSSDIETLIQEVSDIVFSKMGIRLIREVLIIGR